jgi:hypothetical protein
MAYAASYFDVQSVKYRSSTSVCARDLIMTAPYPPPPPTNAPAKTRPSVVTKYGVYLLIAFVVAIIIGVIDLVTVGPPWNYVIGIIVIILGVFCLIISIGLLAGQAWALKAGGYSNRTWTQAPEVRAFFGLPPVAVAYPPGVSATPPPPTCPTCGQPLRYIEQYQRWYCDREQKYV